jgi:pyruvate dehydrogenase E1 component alpha subunit
MYAAAHEAVEHARAGHGPTFIEAKTFRFHGHLLGDDSHYIPAEEMAAAVAADPLPIYRQALLDRQIPEATLDSIDAKIAEDVEAAASEALASPYPDPSEIGLDVFEREIAA